MGSLMLSKGMPSVMGSRNYNANKLNLEEDFQTSHSTMFTYLSVGYEICAS